MIICGYEKFSMVDYDGNIACTVFTGGCNFRCPFCHNAPLVIGDLAQEQMNGEEVFDYLQKRKGLVDAVCVTGGEPTLQPDLAEFLQQVRDMGYKTKLDTNGLRPDVVEKILAKGLVDYVAMDVKNSPQKYPLTVGLDRVDISKIQASIDLLNQSGVDHEFRTTLIKEFHTDEDMQAIAAMVKNTPRYFMQKYKDIDGCIAHGYTPVDKADALLFKTYFENTVPHVDLRGYN